MYSSTKVKQFKTKKVLTTFFATLLLAGVLFGVNASNVLKTFTGNPPVAVDDSVTVNSGNPIGITPLVNDTDPDGDINPTGITLFAGPNHGQAMVAGNTIYYLPTTGYTGADSIVYVVKDLTNLTDTGVIFITVQPNTCTLIADYTYTTDTTGVINVSGAPVDSTFDYVWDFGDGSGNLQGMNLSHTYSAAGTYNVCLLVIDSLNMCNDTVCKSVVIEIDTVVPCNLTADFNYNVDTLGLGTFAASPSGTAYSYAWDFGDSATAIGSIENHQFDSSGTYNVCLTVTETANPTCTSQVCKIVAVSIADTTTTTTCNLSASVVSQVDNSMNGNVTYDILPGDAVMYDFDFGDGETLSLPSSNYTHTYANSGTYTTCIIVTDANSCKDTVCVTDNVIVNNNTTCGIANVSVTGAVAGNGSSVDFTATPNNLFTGYTYIWEFGDGSTDTTGGGLFGGNTITHSYSTPGTYNACVYVTNNPGVCADMACTSVVITNSNPGGCSFAPDFTETSDSTGTANFTGSPSALFGSSYTYSWDFGDGNTGYGSGSAFFGNQISHTYATSGNYTVCLIVTDTVAACADTICKMVSIFRDTVCNLTGDFTFTQDSTGAVNFTATPGGFFNTNYTYEWDFGDGNTSTGNGGFSPNTATNTYTTAGQYTVCMIITQVATGCMDTVCKNVDVVIDTTCNVTASFTYTQDSTGSVTFTGAPSGLIGGYTYYWNFGDGSPVDTTSGALLGNQSTHVYGSAGSYNACVTVVEDASGCTNTYCESITVVIDTACSITAAYTFTQDSTGSVTFTASPSGLLGGFTYYWNYGDGSPVDTTSGILLANQSTHTYASAGSYVACVTVLEDASGCSDTYCQSVTVVIDTVCTLTAGYTLTQDSSGTVNFTASPTSPIINGYTYIWNFGDGSAADTTTGIIGIVNNHAYATAGNYNVCVTVIDPVSNCTDTYCSSVAVVINSVTPTCNADFTFVQDSVTATATVRFNAVSSAAGDTYSWNFGDSGSGSNTSTLVNPTHVYTTNGNYNVCLTLTNGSCIDTVCKNVSITQIGVKELNSNPFAASIFPNPVSGIATISYNLPESGMVNVELFDVTGAKVVSVFESNQTTGNHKLSFNASALANGMYFVRISCNGQVYNHLFSKN